MCDSEKSTTEFEFELENVERYSFFMDILELRGFNSLKYETKAD